MEFLTRILALVLAGAALYEKYIDWKAEKEDKEDLQHQLQAERAHLLAVIPTTTALFTSYKDMLEEYVNLSASLKKIDNIARVHYLEQELDKAERQLKEFRMLSTDLTQENLGFRQYIRNMVQDDPEEGDPKEAEDGTI